jgi:hypothetical protein
MNFNFNTIFTFKFFLILSWVGTLASINSGLDDFKSLSFNLIDIVNFSRFLFPIFAFLIFFILVLKDINKLNFNYLFFFLLLGFTQFVSYFLNDYSITDIYRYQILLGYFSVIFILLFSDKIELDFKNLFIIFVILLSAVIISYIYALIKHSMYLGKLDYFYFIFSGILQNNEYGIIGQQNPRATGLSRQMVIVFCFLFYLINSFNLKNFRFFLIFIILFILSLFIWGLQSRGSIICWLVMWFVYLIFDNKNFLTKIYLVFTLFIVPISLFEISINHQIKQQKKLNENQVTTKENQVTTNKNRIFGDHFNLVIKIENENTGEISLEKSKDYTTGRIYIWKRGLMAILEKPFFGYGPQGDRVVLSVDKAQISSSERHIWDNNASNAIIYTGLSAGIIGITFLILIYFLFIINLFKSIFLFKIFHSNDFFIKNCVTLILIFMVRSIYENSFALFSIDYIGVIVSFSYIIKYLKKNNSLTEN